MEKSPRQSDPGAALRAAAAGAVFAVAMEGHALERALAQAGEEIASPRDRALLAALVYTTLRWYPRLDALRAAMLSRPLPRRERVVHELIHVGLAQLAYLRTPPHAAVHSTVAAAGLLGHPGRRALVNAVLRRYQREGDALAAAVDRDPAARHAHPRWLVERLQQLYPDEADALLAAGNQHPPMWLRVNRRKGSRDEYGARLAARGWTAHAHPEAADALRLGEPVDVGELPGFAEGDVSVQDAAAQLAVDYLALAPGLRLLDACAAPGGKTAHALEREPALAEVVAVDRSARRLAELESALGRLGLNATVVAGDAAEPANWWDGTPFDRILLDAPCSATGVIRRHPDIKLRRDPQGVTAMVQLQSALLDALWPLLAPGGRLLYATCSLLAEENEQQIAAFLQRHPRARQLPLSSAGPAERRVRTGELEMDGFYFAALQKPAETGS